MYYISLDSGCELQVGGLYSFHVCDSCGAFNCRGVFIVPDWARASPASLLDNDVAVQAYTAVDLAHLTVLLQCNACAITQHRQVMSCFLVHLPEANNGNVKPNWTTI